MKLIVFLQKIGGETVDRLLKFGYFVDRVSSKVCIVTALHRGRNTRFLFGNFGY